MKISVIIPVYNVAGYVRKSIESVINQDYLGEVEIICVNDGSTDGSREILSEFDELVVIDQGNQGPSAARNTGLRKATGKYVFFLDSDDYLPPDALEILYKVAIEKDVEVVGGEMQLISPDSELDVLSRPDGIYNQTFTGFDYLNKDYEHLYACNKLYKREFLIDNNFHFIEGITFEDMEFTPRIYMKAKSVILIPNVTYFYVQRPGSITNSVAAPISHPFKIIESFDKMLKVENNQAIKEIKLKLIKNFIIPHLPTPIEKDQRYKNLNLPWIFFSSNQRENKIYGLKLLTGFHQYGKFKTLGHKIKRVLKN